MTLTTSNCTCLKCVLTRAYDAWLTRQEEESVSQEEVVLACVKFLGEVVGDMPKYEAFKPIRIIIAGEREDIPLRLN